MQKLSPAVRHWLKKVTREEFDHLISASIIHRSTMDKNMNASSNANEFRGAWWISSRKYLLLLCLRNILLCLLQLPDNEYIEMA